MPDCNFLEVAFFFLFPKYHISILRDNIRLGLFYIKMFTLFIIKGLGLSSLSPPFHLCLQMVRSSTQLLQQNKTSPGHTRGTVKQEGLRREDAGGGAALLQESYKKELSPDGLPCAHGEVRKGLGDRLRGSAPDAAPVLPFQVRGILRVRRCRSEREGGGGKVQPCPQEKSPPG